jgi:hypothetical protein
MWFVNTFFEKNQKKYPHPFGWGKREEEVK